MVDPVRSVLRYSLRRKVRRHGFWFVDIPRTSSSSLRTELARRFGPVYGKSNLLDERLRRLSLHRHEWLKRLGIRDHSTAQQVRDVLGPRLWADVFTFSLVRNPWDRMASLYFYRVKRGHISPGLSFRDYARQLLTPQYGVRNSMHSRPAYYYSACEYICDQDGGLMVDFVGRYEEREQFVETVSKALSCPAIGVLATQQATPPGFHYSSLYDSETECIVGNAYAKDIALFGYRFERRS